MSGDHAVYLCYMLETARKAAGKGSGLDRDRFFRAVVSRDLGPLVAALERVVE